MKRSFQHHVFPLLCIALSLIWNSSSATAQIIESDAEILRVTQTPDGLHRSLIGNVRILYRNIHIHCDTAVEIPSQSKILLLGNVKIRKDSLHIFTNKIIIDQREQLFTVPHTIYLQDTNYSLTANAGTYNATSNLFTFTGSVVLRSDTILLHAHSLEYWYNTKEITAQDSVMVLFPQKRFLQSEFLEGNLQHDAFTMVGKVQLWHFPSHAFSDTIHLQADTVSVLRDTLRAKKDVILSSQQFTAYGASLFLTDSSLQIHQNAHVWLDSLYSKAEILYLHQEPDSRTLLSCIGNAHLFFPSSSLYPNRWHQLRGDTITIELLQKELQMIQARRNAHSVYFLFDEQQPSGAAEQKADRINLFFKNDTLFSAIWENRVYGSYYPENQIQKEQVLFSDPQQFSPKLTPAQLPWNKISALLQ